MPTGPPDYFGGDSELYLAAAEEHLGCIIACLLACLPACLLACVAYKRQLKQNAVSRSSCSMIVDPLVCQTCHYASPVWSPWVSEVEKYVARH